MIDVTFEMNSLLRSGWSTEGVATMQTNATQVECASNHLTSFAILVAPQPVSFPKLFKITDFYLM